MSRTIWPTVMLAGRLYVVAFTVFIPATLFVALSPMRMNQPAVFTVALPTF